MLQYYKMSEELVDLLVDIKAYLSKNMEGQGVFSLIGRVDRAIEQMGQQTGMKEPVLSQKSTKQPDDQFQILTQPEIEQAELLDVFLMEFDFEASKYGIKLILPEGDRFGEDPHTMDSHRHALLSLMIGENKQHCILKEKTSSMTELHQLISNIPASSASLILPNYTSKVTKYTYIYESKECVSWQQSYYLVDRYYCIVTNRYAEQSAGSLMKQMKNRIFLARMLNSTDVNDVDYLLTDQILTSISPDLAALAGQSSLQICNIENCPDGEKELTYQSSRFKKQKISRMISYVFMACLNEQKVVFVSTKDKRHKISDFILSLESALHPLRYEYPVALCTLSNDHCEFLESPVPLIIGMWGSPKKVAKFTKYVQKHYSPTETEEQKIPISIIDIQKYSVLGYSRFSAEDCFILEKMETYLWKYGKGDNFQQKISNLISMLIAEMHSQKQYSQWMQSLSNKIRNSQMYSVFIQQ